MRPGQISRLSYRDVLSEYELILCEDPATCVRGLSANAHRHGAADGMGHIHWARPDRKVTRRGLRRLLTLIAQVELNTDRTVVVTDKHGEKKRVPALPAWQRLYETNLWAWKEGLDTWHVQFTQEMSKVDRLRAYRLGGTEARTKNFAAYQWMRGRNKKWVE